MKRRNFIVSSLIAGGAMAVGSSCKRAINVSQNETASSETSEDVHEIVEPARKIPVLAETEVLVIGGGPAGVAAAVAAARGGAETWLVERYNHPIF